MKDTSKILENMKVNICSRLTELPGGNPSDSTDITPSFIGIVKNVKKSGKSVTITMNGGASRTYVIDNFLNPQELSHITGKFIKITKVEKYCISVFPNHDPVLTNPVTCAALSYIDDHPGGG